MSKRISKMLFSKERVELNEIKDLRAALKKISQLKDSAYGMNKDALTIQDNLKPLLNKIEQEKKYAKDVLDAAKDDSYLEKAESDLKSKFNELSKAASNLGVSPMDLPIYKEYNAAKQNLKEAKDFKSDAISILNKLI
tara:strand:- start:1324 stop:1737 length:414 start_codon:yes stop_codon:yes gene_type:complete